MTASVSVYIACYKYAHFLRDCVHSVLSQTGVDVRVLIVDDASPDDTPAVAAALMAEDPRVEYLRHAENMGHIATYNDGVAWASGDYTMLLSADDLLVPGALARATRALDASPNADMAYGRVLQWHTDDPLPEPATRGESCAFVVHRGRDWVEARCRTSVNPLYTPEVLVRTAMQKQLGDWRSDLPHAADFELWMRLAAHGDVVELDADQAFYRLHGSNMHDAIMKSRFDLEQRDLVFTVFFEQHAGELSDVDQLKTFARRALARSEMAYSSQLLEASGDCRAAITSARSAMRRDARGALVNRKFPAFLLRLTIGASLYARARRRAVVLREAYARRRAGTA